jgi:peptidyl-prolyl cis-trans isomerase SurA
LKKAFFLLIFSTLLYSEYINGVAIRVNGKAITTFDIEDRKKKFGISKSKAVESLIQEILESSEIEKFKLEVSDSEIDRFLENFMKQRNITSKTALFQQLSNSGISEKNFLKKLKAEALKPKLFRTISAGKIGTPINSELVEFFEKNRFKFVSNGKYSVTIYSSKSLEALQQKMQNPMMFNQNVFIKDEVLDISKLNDQFRSALNGVTAGDFTQPLQTQQGFFAFYVKDIEKGDEITFEDVKAEVENEYYMIEQGKFIKRHFEKLREEAVIEYIR